MNKSKYEVSILPQFNSACGIDVHKDMIMLYFHDLITDVVIEKEFGSMTCDLRRIAKLLSTHDCQVILMESTGIYWISLYQILEHYGLNVLVANPMHIKHLPKQKTDKKDAKWLCKLAINRMVKQSFIPTLTQHNLRQYARLRDKTNQQLTSTYNRIVKIIERGNIKIRSVASTIRIKSCERIISAIIEGQTDPKELAQMSLGRLRKKIPQLELALDGNLSDSDIDILKLLKLDLEHYNKQIQSIEQRIENLIHENYMKPYELLLNVSGIGKKTAESILAEIGIDMSKFPTGDHLTAWAGLAPGNKESNKKSKSVSSRKGNAHLKTTMIRIAWSAVRTKDSYWMCRYAQMSRRMKPQKTIVAIARRLLKLIFKILDKQLVYIEGGTELFMEHQRKRIEYLKLKKVC